MDCATMSSDVIGDFQEPYGAVLVEGDNMQRCLPLPSKAARMLARAAPNGANLPGRGQSNATHEATFSIIEMVEAVEEMHAVSSIRSLKATSIEFSRNVCLSGGDAFR
jgi:hypothetical protein